MTLVGKGGEGREDKGGEGREEKGGRRREGGEERRPKPGQTFCPRGPSWPNKPSCSLLFQLLGPMVTVSSHCTLPARSTAVVVRFKVHTNVVQTLYKRASMFQWILGRFDLFIKII